MPKTYFKGGQRVDVITQTLTPVAVAAAVCAEQTFTVPGLLTTQFVEIVGAPTGNATASVGCRVSAANTLAITFCNPTAGSLTPGAGAYRILVWDTVA
jgi:hypothetical protein